MDGKILAADKNLNIKIEKFNINKIKISNEDCYFLAIGDVNIRKKFYTKLIKKNASLPNLFSKYSLIDKTAEIGSAEKWGLLEN